MQFTVILTSILSVASAAAITERSLPTKLFGRDAGKLVRRDVCGPLESPLCCQLDVEGVANLNCENAGSVSTTEEFEATCAETGLTAECCVLAVGTDGLLCTAA
ncbi:fungal hydrophobin-domain-containing protein [Lophiotrema nucula]|uniref:Fungal hydrophobin-domain-containing protein n=1 Tax=Lophiotrema nucula TaxID=690887 RepID=A0A6A5ZA24_9PLEO|nr:fungal hydrophobin-domain-containing protein [Lophiotrema nucula]